jgi:hypothetical protein
VIWVKKYFRKLPMKLELRDKELDCRKKKGQRYIGEGKLTY